MGIKAKDPLTKYVVLENGCWQWTGEKQNAGYGLFRYPKQRRGTTAHRYFYQIYVGKPRKGYAIKQTCKNILCVNPKHLYETKMYWKLKEDVETIVCAGCLRVYQTFERNSKCPLCGKEPNHGRQTT